MYQIYKQMRSSISSSVAPLSPPPPPPSPPPPLPYPCPHGHPFRVGDEDKDDDHGILDTHDDKYLLILHFLCLELYCKFFFMKSYIFYLIYFFLVLIAKEI